GSQTSGLVRWGDYSQITVDPLDDCTFWYTNEYIPANGSFNWETRIGTFKFDECALAANDFSMSAAPPSLSISQGGSAPTTISTRSFQAVQLTPWKKGGAAAVAAGGQSAAF